MCLVEREASAQIVRPVAKSLTQEKLEKILPEQYAKEIAHRSKYPMALGAIAYQETVKAGYDHTAVGDGGASYGLFQIQKRHWGAVPKDVAGQVDKADAIFTQLVAEYGYREAIKRWNGSGRKARTYQARVLKVANNITKN